MATVISYKSLSIFAQEKSTEKNKLYHIIPIKLKMLPKPRYLNF
jgi:hypothetical protein